METREATPRLPAVLLVAGGVASLHPAISSAVALALGALVGLTVGNPHRALTQKLSTRLLQACIVGLGFGMSFLVVLGVGGRGVVVTAAVVGAALATGLALGRLLRTGHEPSLLISCGTAICGGSAIAAVGSAIAARGEAMSVALAVVFVLNAVALWVFPAVGQLLDLSQAQFGVWAALAIHDTSSVVGAASVYGAGALQQATVLKLARALWIIPLAVGAGLHARLSGRVPGEARLVLPWFILFFVLAAVVRSASAPSLVPTFDAIARYARAALPLVLFLIGAGLTRSTLRAIGPRPFVQAVLLWLLVAGATLGGVLLLAAS